MLSLDLHNHPTCELIEDSVEKHLCNEELIGRGQFTGDPSLALDDILLRSVAQSPQHTLTAFEFLQLQHTLRGTQLSLRHTQVGPCLNMVLSVLLL